MGNWPLSPPETGSRMNLTKEQMNRFAAKVDKRSHDECWEWLGARNKQGYGSVTVNGQGQATHRVSWELFFGPIPEGELVLHKCNNPSCVNPYHLCPGSYSDNMLDAVRAKTHGGFAQRKLDDEDANKVRQLLREGKTVTQVARAFGAARATVSKIRKGSPCYPKGEQNESMG